MGMGGAPHGLGFIYLAPLNIATVAFEWHRDYWLISNYFGADPVVDISWMGIKLGYMPIH